MAGSPGLKGNFMLFMAFNHVSRTSLAMYGLADLLLIFIKIITL